jgi:hypothetical protein
MIYVKKLKNVIFDIYLLSVVMDNYTIKLDNFTNEYKKIYFATLYFYVNNEHRYTVRLCIDKMRICHEDEDDDYDDKPINLEAILLLLKTFTDNLLNNGISKIRINNGQYNNMYIEKINDIIKIINYNEDNMTQCSIKNTNELHNTFVKICETFEQLI